MILLGWIVGVILTLVGLVWLCFTLSFRHLTKAEVELMRRDGKFEGEPEYMRDFRVTRSEWDLERNTKYVILSSVMLAVGLAVLVAVVFFSLWK